MDIEVEWDAQLPPERFSDNNRMKVAMVLDGLWVGGTERSTVEILPYLIRANIHPVLICLRHRAEEGVEQQVLQSGYEVRFLAGNSFAQNVRHLRNSLRSERPDLVHSSLFEANHLSRFAAIGLKVPVLTSIVNTPYDPVRFRDPAISRFRLKSVQQMDAWTSRFLTTHFHAVSHYAKECAIRDLRIAASRITVVERGRDSSRLGVASPERRSKARQQFGFTQEDFILVNVGRHEFQKAQELLIQAVSKVIPECPNVKLVIAGRKGSASERLSSLRDRLGLNSVVQLLGHSDHIPEILAASDLFVFPSLFEGMPGAMIEAMALSLPIIASDIPSNREVVEEKGNAILVAPGSPAEFANAVVHLIKTRDLRNEFGKRSYAIFNERFTMDKIAPRMIDLYESVISKALSIGA